MNTLAPAPKNSALSPKRNWEKETYATRTELFTSMVTGLNSSDPAVIDVTIHALEHTIEQYGHEPIRPSTFSEPNLRYSTGIMLGQIPITRLAKQKIREAAELRPELGLGTLLKPSTPDQLKNLAENIAYMETRQTFRDPSIKKAEFSRWANQQQQSDEATYPTESPYEENLKTFLDAGPEGITAGSCLDRVGTNGGYQDVETHIGEQVGLRPAISRNRFDLIRSLATVPGRILWAAAGNPGNLSTYQDIERLRTGVRTAALAKTDPSKYIRPEVRINSDDAGAQERASREVGSALTLLPFQRGPALGLLARLKTDLTVRGLRNRIEMDHNPGRVLARAGLSEREQSILPAEIRESILVYGARQEIGAFQKLAIQEPNREDVRKVLASDQEACNKMMPNWCRLNLLNPEKATRVLQLEGDAAREQIRRAPAPAREAMTQN